MTTLIVVQMFDLQTLLLNASDITSLLVIQQVEAKFPLVSLTFDEKILWQNFHSKSLLNSPPRDTATETVSKLNYPECVAERYSEKFTQTRPGM